jgi:hypothetical protein
MKRAWEHLLAREEYTNGMVYALALVAVHLVVGVPLWLFVPAWTLFMAAGIAAIRRRWQERRPQ